MKFTKQYAALAVSLLLAIGLVAGAQEKTLAPLFQTKGELTDKDPPYKAVPKSFSKIHKINLMADKGYRIELASKDFDALLLLTDENDKILAGDDDGGGGTNARVLFRPTKNGEFRLVVTSSLPAETGKYSIVATPATAGDLLTLRARQFPKLGRDERAKFLEDLLDHYDALGKKTTPDDARIALMVGGVMEDNRMPGVGDFYRKAGQALAVSDSEDVRDSALMLEGCGRRVRLPGNTMALKGTKLDGKPLDWNSYRGKIVLVDFWATWCGPCIREMPNIRRLHAAYKDKGFDVVAISLDNDYDDLETFFKRNKAFPWACVFEKNAKRQPLGDYYGVVGIPLPILVDKAGKVVSMDARGPELDRLLEQYLGPAPEVKSDEK
jgi:thiol-disulfide isomerase/thioredoxin